MNLIEFTPEAIAAIHTYHRNLHVPADHFLRVGIRQKNEANRRLVIGFDVKGAHDKEVEIEGLKVIYSPGEIFFFAGMKIDYVEEEGRKGFTFVETKSTRP